MITISAARFVIELYKPTATTDKFTGDSGGAGGIFGMEEENWRLDLVNEEDSIEAA